MNNITRMKLTFFSTITLYIIFSVILIILIRKQTYFRYHGPKGNKSRMKFILLWTKQEHIPFIYIREGRKGFIDRKCPYTNCIVTDNDSLLSSYTEFDAVLFAGPDLLNIDKDKLPAKRSPHQKFVFVSTESPSNYPLCYHKFDGFFNWTWTYKLNSDMQWGYIAIRDTNNNIVGPKKDMQWLDWNDMQPVSDEFKLKLKTKKKAAAWFVSHCHSRSRREEFAENLLKELRIYNLTIDIYGFCGKNTCRRTEQQKCNKLISNDYYFYLSFENAFSEDYVTEALLIPLQNNAVPIVYGGANYTRFLPYGSYLNARELGAHILAKIMHELIKDPKLYADMFRWKNHYSYHKTSDSVETNEYCKMCAALNDNKAMQTTSIHEDFSEWWGAFDSCE